MKNLLRIMIVAAFLGIIIYYTSIEPVTKPLQGPNIKTQAVPTTQIVNDAIQVIERPKQGLSTYIGESSEVIIHDFGIPTRIEPSSFNYDWWVYIRDNEFIMISVENDVVNQVYTNSVKYDVSPYIIKQSLEDIYRMTIVENEIAVEVDESVYLFMMNEADMKSRILVAFEGVYAQLYIDDTTKELAGIRFISGDVLVQHQPYEFQYIGSVIQPNVPSSFDQTNIDLAYANQVYNLVNEFRLQHNLPKFLRSPLFDGIAQEHSESLYVQKLQSLNGEDEISMKDRLMKNNVEYKGLEENVAEGYYDSIEVIHGWLNSKKHRANMLNKKYNIAGVGVYLNTYSQLYIEKEMPEASE